MEQAKLLMKNCGDDWNKTINEYVNNYVYNPCRLFGKSFKDVLKSDTKNLNNKSQYYGLRMQLKEVKIPISQKIIHNLYKTILILLLALVIMSIVQLIVNSDELRMTSIFILFLVLIMILVVALNDTKLRLSELESLAIMEEEKDKCNFYNNNNEDKRISTQSDKIETEQNSNESQLQKKLKNLASHIGQGSITTVFATAILLITSLYIANFVIVDKHWEFYYIKYIINSVSIAITVIVVAVPEALPVAVTAALAYSMKKMTRNNNLVHYLNACEKMGNATTICLNKTETLTTNRMQVTQGYICGDHHKSISALESIPESMSSIMIDSIIINSTHTTCISNAENSLAEQISNRTEEALVRFLLEHCQDYQRIRHAMLENALHKVYSFNSVRKSLTTVIPIKNGFRVFSKGAPEILISKCQFIYGKDGKVENLTAEARQNILNTVAEPMDSEGLRTICIAYKDYVKRNIKSKSINQSFIDSEPNWKKEDEICSNLTCISILGVEEFVETDVPKAIRLCQKAGITVRILTGDTVNTSRAIALKCGIIAPDENHLALDGKEFNKLIRNSDGYVDQELFNKVWSHLRILACASPNDKYILVKHIMESKLNSNREVVAMIGNSLNDIQALKAADVGFAMNIAGVEQDREESDIIFTEDNFSNIIKDVMWGRKVNDSIVKFLRFLFTINVVAVSVEVVGSLSDSGSPFKSTQMLWAILFIYSMSSLALSTEIPKNKLLLSKIYGREKAEASRSRMIKFIFLQALFELVIIFFILYCSEKFFSIESALNDSGDSTPADNSSIIRSVMWGRNVYESIAKFLQYQLTVNLLAITVVFIGACAIKDSPLKAVQMLCIKLSMDTLTSLSSFELPTKESLLNKSACTERQSKLFSMYRIKKMFGQSIYQLIVLMLLYFAGDKMFCIESPIDDLTHSEPSQQFTLIFNAFVIMSLFNEFKAIKIQRDKNIFKCLFSNLTFYGLFAFAIFVHVIIVQYGGTTFNTTPLTLAQWKYCTYFGVGVIVWDKIIERIPTEYTSLKTLGKCESNDVDDLTGQINEDVITDAETCKPNCEDCNVDPEYSEDINMSLKCSSTKLPRSNLINDNINMYKSAIKESNRITNEFINQINRNIVNKGSRSIENVHRLKWQKLIAKDQNNRTKDKLNVYFSLQI